jgi:O-antigen ligase
MMETRRFRQILQRYMLWRRTIDGPLLIVALAVFFVMDEITAVVLGAFTVVGTYLLLFRRKSRRRVDRPYAVATLILAAGAVAIGFLNGSLPGDWRYATYPLYHLALLPLGAALTVIGRPMRPIALGARLGIVVISVWALAAMAVDPSRHGFGSNPANTAFAICLFAILSRLKTADLPHLLGNRRVFFYLAIIPVLATGVRSVLPLFVAGALIDIWNLTRRGSDARPPAGRQVVTGAIASLVVILVAGWIAAPTVFARVDAMVVEMNTVSAPVGAENGLAVRLSQWATAGQVIADRPVLGHGGAGAIAAQAERLPEEKRRLFITYPFSHNAVLDEWMQRGILGVILTFGFLGFALFRIHSKGDGFFRENAVLMGVLMISFGMLHYLLLIDSNVALIAVSFSIMTIPIRGSPRPWIR